MGCDTCVQHYEKTIKIQLYKYHDYCHGYYNLVKEGDGLLIQQEGVNVVSGSEYAIKLSTSTCPTEPLQ